MQIILYTSTLHISGKIAYEFVNITECKTFDMLLFAKVKRNQTFKTNVNTQ